MTEKGGACEEEAEAAHAALSGVPLRSVSYGGGQDSTALLVLAAQRRIDYSLFLFANTGDDSEHPDTLRYLREVATPYAAKHGIELVELHRVRRDGTPETLRQRLDAGRMAIPVRREKDGPPMSRSCTADFKVRVVGKELKRRGATAATPATVAIGITVDEIERAKPGIDPRAPYQNRTYPLLDLGLHRRDCVSIISGAGLPIPPKSSCWFCPHHSIEAWRRLKRQTPELFAGACELESSMSAATKDGRPVFLTRAGRPLVDVIDDQEQLPGLGDDCDSGWCFT